MYQMQDKTRVPEVIFGPINSRRFGKSLGIDLSPNLKQCNFDCLYCELEAKKTQEDMQTLIKAEEIIAQLQPKITPNLDVITITANGEPTLYPHLYELIFKIKNLIPKHIKTLILSNGSKFGEEEIQKALLLFDIVKFSLDGGSQKIFSRIDRPHKNLDFSKIIQGIVEFSKIYKGELIAEVLFIKNINDKKENLIQLANIFEKIKPKRIDISTIDRPPAYKTQPLNQKDLQEIHYFFTQALPDIAITMPSRNADTQKITIANQQHLLELIQRRPLEINEAKNILDSNALFFLDTLLNQKSILIQKIGDLEFYTTRNSK